MAEAGVLKNSAGRALPTAPRTRTNLRARLRQATSIPHRKLERHFALDDVRSRHDYRALLEKLFAITLPLEESLSRIDWRDSGIVIADRRKLSWLIADLDDLGMTAPALAALERCRDLPRLDDPASGLGALYVLEGATLGGQVILRSLPPLLGISPLFGGRFFASYGKAIGAMWQDYLAALEHVGGSPLIADRIEAAALETFAAWERWFARDGRASRRLDENIHV